MARSLSRGRFDRTSPAGGRFDHISPGLESTTDIHRQSLYSAAPWTTVHHSTPPRSPLDRRHHDYYSDTADHRNPAPEGRGGGGTFGRSGSNATAAMRDFGDDVFLDDRSIGEFSEAHARDVLSRMRSGGGGGISSRPIQPPPRASSSPRGRVVVLDRHRLEDVGTMTYDDRGGGGDVVSSSRSRYEVLGMMEDLKTKERQVSLLRREMTELEMKHEKETSLLHRDMNEMHSKHEEELASVRARLVSTFKDDMQEMKAQWDEDHRRLKEELNNTSRSRADLEAQLAEYRVAIEEEKRMSRAAIEEEKRMSRAAIEEEKRMSRAAIEEERRRFAEQTEDLKKSKEDDLERLRGMYEEHLNGLKGEINMLLEENEKVKMCYLDLETENQRNKADYDELNSDYDKALKESVRWEKEAMNLKGELNNICDENDKYARHCEALERKEKDFDNELDRVTKQKARFERECDAANDKLERMTSQQQRTQAEKTQLERELTTVSKEREDAIVRYDDLVKKLDEIQEERTLESRYTEALVKQRDNMNAIIESTQQEMDELKSLIQELSGLNKQYAEIEKEFDLPPGNPSAIHEELMKAARMKERLDVLSKERERYNATVKALKVDLQILHGGDVGTETSLQEHMRLLNEKWETNASYVKQVDKLKTELEEGTRLLQDHIKERESMIIENNDRVGRFERDLEEARTSLANMERERENMITKHHDRVSELEKDLEEAQTVLVKMERDQFSLKSELTALREVEKKCEVLQDQLDKVASKKKKDDDVNRGLQKKLEEAYYELTSLRQDHENEIQTYEAELNQSRKIQRKDTETIESQHLEIKRLKEMLNNSQKLKSQDMEDIENEVAESYKLQIRLIEEKHEEQDRCNKQKIEELERELNEEKESHDQKSMMEIKRRGEFAKQRQEIEILRSKERHLETHVNQLEEHISKVVADYETKLQSSGITICSNVKDEEITAMKKQVRELEKKLEVTNAAMKQLGKNSLLMEKENERLKNDKNELKSKLKKLVDCAEKFGPK
ncbi:hypothetical protein ACHAXA_002243 [Cyclostephanos tholiformis]|uniref:CARD domain-containing protein n=1 Tax=Cyclostephanos tholiformis TaxID=382380 RepID=A0ABD3R528_9STRA